MRKEFRGVYIPCGWQTDMQSLTLLGKQRSCVPGGKRDINLA